MLLQADTAPNISPAEAGKKIAKIKADAAAAAETAAKKKPSQNAAEADADEDKAKPKAKKTTKKPPAKEAAAEPEDQDNSDASQSDAEGEDGEDLDLAAEADDQPEDDEGQDHDGEAEEQDDDGAEDDGTLHTVLVDGKELQVPLKELLQGYSRTKDYTQKTEALAKQRKEVEALQEKVKDLPQVREKYAQDGERFSKNAALVLAALQHKFMPSKPDAALLKADPAGYVAAKERFEEAQQFMGALQHEMNNIAGEHVNNHKKALAEGAKKLLEIRPELKDPATKAKLVGYAFSLGFTQQQLENEANPVLFDLAYKAMLYDEIQGKKKTIRAENSRPKVMKQTKAEESRKAVEQKKRSDAIAAHAANGTVNSGAAAISALRAKKKA